MLIMNERSLSEILAMSGYGAYVWGAFAVVLLALLMLYTYSQRSLKKALETQQQLRKPELKKQSSQKNPHQRKNHYETR